MDHRKLAHLHEYFGLSGRCLNIQERVNLQSSLVLLKRDGKFNHLTYWGKIYGVKGDYHIAQGFAKSLLDERTTFYSVDNGLTWKQLTKYNEDLNQYLTQIKGYFAGDPSYTYLFNRIKTPEELAEEERVRLEEEENKRLAAAAKKKMKKPRDDEESGEESEEDEEEEGEEGEGEDGGGSKKKKKEKDLVKVTEEVRLVYAINNIDHDTSVVPRGSYIKKLNGMVEPNLIFQGLDKFKSGKLEHYLHLRPPEKEKPSLEKQFLKTSVDFCDTIEEDIPNKCWVLQYEDAKDVIVGKSLLWPGYVFFHVPRSPTYGSFYFGNGQKNVDMCFMV